MADGGQRDVRDFPRSGAMPDRAWPRLRVSTDAARLSRSIGRGWRIPLDTPGRATFLEILSPAIPASISESEKVADALRGTVLEAREGRLVLGAGGLALLCLLGGIPWPISGGVAKERLRAAAAVVRLPAPLDDLHLSLARLQAPSLSPVYRILASVSKAKAARQEALVRQRLHVRSDDLSCYCEAWASPRIWDALMRSGSPMSGHGMPALSSDSIPLRFSFALGSIRASRRELAHLRPGDVVRMPMWLGPDGVGSVVIAGVAVTLRCFGQGPERRFEVIATGSGVEAAQTDPTRLFVLPPSVPPPGIYAMNVNSPPPSEFPGVMPEGMQPPATAPNPAGHGSDLTDLLDAMPVVLVAEVGTLRLSVATLRALAPGVLLEIEPHATAEVVLRSEQGRHLAGGQLVDIDGRMGIQITQLGSA